MAISKVGFRIIAITLLLGIFAVFMLDTWQDIKLVEQYDLLIQLENKSIIQATGMTKACERKSMIYERYEMYGINESLFINGVYIADKYYAIWTENKTQAEIEENKGHEQCHVLIRHEKKGKITPTHFCFRK